MWLHHLSPLGHVKFFSQLSIRSRSPVSCRSSVSISPPSYQLVVIIIKLGLPLRSLASQRILGKCRNCKSIMQMSREREKKGPVLVFALFFFDPVRSTVFKMGISTCFPFSARHPRDSKRECVQRISDQVLDTNGKTIKRTQCWSMVLGGLFRNIWGSAVHPTTYQRRGTGFLVFFIVIFNLSPRSADGNVSRSVG